MHYQAPTNANLIQMSRCYSYISLPNLELILNCNIEKPLSRSITSETENQAYMHAYGLPFCVYSDSILRPPILRNCMSILKNILRKSNMSYSYEAFKWFSGTGLKRDQIEIRSNGNVFFNDGGLKLNQHDANLLVVMAMCL